MSDVHLPHAPLRWAGFLYIAMVIVACAFALVGLSASSFWIDELFTLYVTNHQGGLAEVFRRALTDVHPPLYYFFLYGWTRLFGISEWSVRLPSAVLAISALLIFAVGVRRVASRTAIAFACAVAVISPFWFEQSQNARSYALGMTLAAAILVTALAVFRQYRRQEGVPLPQLSLLMLLGLAASFTHAYLLLTFGMVLFYLLLTMANWRIRLLIVLGGLTVLLGNTGYYWLLMHSTQQDLHNLAFENSAKFLVTQARQAVSDLLPPTSMLVVIGLLMSLWLIRPKSASMITADVEEARWATQLSGLVLVGVFLSGIAVSRLVAPSFSNRNLLICVPFAWLLLARFYDSAGPTAHSRGSNVLAALIVVLLGSSLILLNKGRLLQRNEPWRQSADYIRTQYPQCLNQLLPVVLPFKFGPATPPFRSLAQNDFFGHYLPEATQLQADLPAELAMRHPRDGVAALFVQRAAVAGKGGCPVLAWGVHDLDEASALKIAQDLARQPTLSGHRVVIQEFDAYAQRRLMWHARAEGFVFVLSPRTEAAANSIDPPVKTALGHAGNRIIVNYLATNRGNDGTPFQIDVYSIQTWPSNGNRPSEDFIANQRLVCDPPTEQTRKGVWPDPSDPSCSQRLPPSQSLGRVAPGN